MAVGSLAVVVVGAVSEVLAIAPVVTTLVLSTVEVAVSVSSAAVVVMAVAAG